MTGTVSADEIAAWAATAPTGEAVWTPFGPVAAQELSQGGRLDLLIGLERVRSWVDAQQARVLAYLDAHPEPVPAGPRGRHDIAAARFVRDEVACALSWSPGTVGMRMNDATALTTRLPETLAALEDGTIPYSAARTLAQATGPLAAADAAVVQDRVLDRASRQTPAEFARTVRRAVTGIDPRGATQRHEDAASERRVVHRSEPDAMAWLHAYLPAVDAAAIMTGVQSAADAAAHDGSDRTSDQRRADALVDLCLRGTGHGAGHISGPGADGPGPGATSPRTSQGRKPSVQVSVALSTLLGLDEQPGDLDGYGPIPAELARRLAADPTGTWRRLLTDDYGRLLDYGRTTYRPPADLRDFVVARDRTCTHPVCHRDARRCDLDHLTDWALGGTTSPDNLGPKCPRHHTLKHDAGWQSLRLPDGTTRWTTPSGRSYDTPPASYPIDTTPTREPDPPPF